MSDIIINRIKKLLKHADSAKELGSIEEAEAFIKKANDLLLAHNLELHQIPLNEDEDMFAKWIYGEDISYKDNQAGNRWQLDLIKVLCKHNLCNYTFRYRLKTFRVYGRLENVDIVHYLFNYLSIGLIRLSRESYKSLSKEKRNNYRSAYLKSFLLGAVDGIDVKLKESLNKSNYKEQVQGLILYNDKALEKFINEKVPNIKTRALRSVNIGEGYEEGFESGKNYSINKPLATEKSLQSKLLN